MGDEFDMDMDVEMDTDFGDDFSDDFAEDIGDDMATDLSDDFTEDLGGDFDDAIEEDLSEDFDDVIEEDLGEDFDDVIEEDLSEDFDDVEEDLSEDFDDAIEEDLGEDFDDTIEENIDDSLEDEFSEEADLIEDDIPEDIVDENIENLGDDTSDIPEEDIQDIPDEIESEDSEGMEGEIDGADVGEEGEEVAETDMEEEPDGADIGEEVEETAGANTMEEGEEVVEADMEDETAGADTVEEGEEVVGTDMEEEPDGADTVEEGEEVAGADIGEEGEEIVGADMEDETAGADTVEEGEEIAGADVEDGVAGADTVEQGEEAAGTDMEDETAGADTVGEGEEAAGADMEEEPDGTDTGEEVEETVGADTMEEGEEIAGTDVEDETAGADTVEEGEEAAGAEIIEENSDQPQHGFDDWLNPNNYDGEGHYIGDGHEWGYKPEGMEGYEYGEMIDQQADDINTAHETYMDEHDGGDVRDQIANGEAPEIQDMGERTAYDDMYDYMTSHNYGLEDRDTYMNDPEWQRLNANLLNELEMSQNLSEGFVNADYEKPSFDEPHMDEHDGEDVQDQIANGETSEIQDQVADGETPEIQDTRERTAYDDMYDYMTSHNYGLEDRNTYMNDPEWQRLNANLLNELGMSQDQSEGITNADLGKPTLDVADETPNANEQNMNPQSVNPQTPDRYTNPSEEQKPKSAVQGNGDEKQDSFDINNEKSGADIKGFNEERIADLANGNKIPDSAFSETQPDYKNPLTRYTDDTVESEDIAQIKLTEEDTKSPYYAKNPVSEHQRNEMYNREMERGLKLEDFTKEDFVKLEEKNPQFGQKLRNDYLERNTELRDLESMPRQLDIYNKPNMHVLDEPLQKDFATVKDMDSGKTYTIKPSPVDRCNSMPGIQGQNELGIEEDCGLASTAKGINDALGKDITSESRTAAYAMETNNCETQEEDNRDNGGTIESNIVNLMHAYNLDTEAYSGHVPSVEYLASQLQSGTCETVAVNADLLWHADELDRFDITQVDSERLSSDYEYRNWVERMMDLQNGGVFQADHFVNVSNAVYDEKGTLESLIVCDTGNGTTKMIDIAAFARAYRGDGDKYYISAAGAVIGRRRQ